jgi:hypothetical protein
MQQPEKGASVMEQRRNLSAMGAAVDGIAVAALLPAALA